MLSFLTTILFLLHSWFFPNIFICQIIPKNVLLLFCVHHVHFNFCCNKIYLQLKFNCVHVYALVCSVLGMYSTDGPLFSLDNRYSKNESGWKSVILLGSSPLKYIYMWELCELGLLLFYNYVIPPSDFYPNLCF